MLMRIPKSRNMAYTEKNGAQRSSAALKARRQRSRMSDGPWNALHISVAVSFIVQCLCRWKIGRSRPYLFVRCSANPEKFLHCYLIDVALAPLLVSRGPLVETPLHIDVRAFVELHGERG